MVNNVNGFILFSDKYTIRSCTNPTMNKQLTSLHIDTNNNNLKGIF